MQFINSTLENLVKNLPEDKSICLEKFAENN